MNRLKKRLLKWKKYLYAVILLLVQALSREIKIQGTTWTVKSRANDERETAWAPSVFEAVWFGRWVVTHSLRGFQLPWPPSCCLYQTEHSFALIGRLEQIRFSPLTWERQVESLIASPAYQKWPTTNPWCKMCLRLLLFFSIFLFLGFSSLSPSTWKEESKNKRSKKKRKEIKEKFKHIKRMRD